MATRLISPAAALAVSLAAAKLELRIDHDALDASVTRWVKGITADAETKTGRSFINKGFRLSLDAFRPVVPLEFPPIVSVQSVKYYDADNVLQTLPPSDYELGGGSGPGRLRPAPGKAWPATYPREDAVVVEYTAGYGATDEAVPDNAKLYILARLTEQYDTASKPRAGEDYTARLLDDLRVF